MKNIKLNKNTTIDLSKLIDSSLPEEARKEAMTIKELKNEIMILRRHRCPKVNSKEDIDKAIKNAELNKERQFNSERTEMIKQTNNFLKIISDIGKIISTVNDKPVIRPITPPLKVILQHPKNRTESVKLLNDSNPTIPLDRIVEDEKPLNCGR